MNHFVNNAKRSLRRMMGGSIIDIVCACRSWALWLSAFSGAFWLSDPESCAGCPGTDLENCNVSSYPPAVTGGDAISFVIFNAIGIYCVRLFGLLVEQVWGRFKFNCYIISGVLLHAAVSVLIYLITGMPLPLFPNYLVYSFFFVFALMFPDMQVLFMMLIP